MKALILCLNLILAACAKGVGSPAPAVAVQSGQPPQQIQSVCTTEYNTYNNCPGPNGGFATCTLPTTWCHNVPSGTGGVTN